MPQPPPSGKEGFGRTHDGQGVKIIPTSPLSSGTPPHRHYSMRFAVFRRAKREQTRRAKRGAVPTAPSPSGDDAFRRAKRDSFCAFCVFCGSNSNLLVFMNVARCLAVELCPDTICQVPAKNSMTVLSPVPPTAIKAVAQGARLNTLAGKSIAIVGGSFMANVTHPELKRLILKEYPNTRCA